MKVLEQGHVYDLAPKTHGGITPIPNVLVFVNQQPGMEHGGTTTQEVLRALVDRTMHCANCMPHPVNERIVYHLRMAIALHEGRALERQVEKDGLAIEHLPTVEGSHLELPALVLPEGDYTAHLLPHPMDGAKEIRHPAPTIRPTADKSDSLFASPTTVGTGHPGRISVPIKGDDIAERLVPRYAAAYPDRLASSMEAQLTSGGDVVSMETREPL